MKINKLKSHKKTFAILTIILLVSIAVYSALAYANQWSPFGVADEIDDQGRKISIQRSSQEKDREKIVSKSADEKNENQSDAPEQPEINTQTQKQKANVLLTSVGQALASSEVEASGMITNIVESDGGCRYIFTSRSTGSEVLKPSVTLMGPKSMTCKTVRFPGEELASGSWDVQVEYSSAVSYGVSEPMELVVR